MADEPVERVIARAHWLAGEALTGAVELRIEQVERRDNPQSMVRVTWWDYGGTQLGGYVMALHPGRPRDVLDDHGNPVPDGMLPIGR